MNFVRLTLLTALFALVLMPLRGEAQEQTPKRVDYNAQPKYYIIGEITTTPLKHVNSEILVSTINLTPGDSILIPGDQIKIAARRLWDQKHFSDVKIETNFRGDTVDLFLNLKERQRVAQWKFSGVNKTQEKELSEKLDVRRNAEFSDYLINANLALIREYYNEKAFRNADIGYMIAPDSVKKGYVTVTFVINPKKKVRIGKFVFEGNEAISGKHLAKSFEKTKKMSINFFQNSKFNDKDFDADRRNLIAYYNSKGYRDAELLADSLFDIDERKIGIWFKVKEGKKYYYRDITWVGNSIYSNEELDFILQLKKGDTYDSDAMGKRLGVGDRAKITDHSVSTKYKDDGYLAFRLEPIETVVRGDSVDVQIRMIEGKQFRINDVSFAGNTRTNDHVIRRELDTSPGDLYSQSLMLRTYQRLATMGQFDPMSLQPNIEPNLENETVDIKYTFTEVTNDKLELSGGWGAGMFIASVGLEFTNVSLRKFFEKDAWRPYPAGDNQRVSIKLNTNGTYYQAFSVGFTEPWLGGRKPTSLNVSIYSSRESNAMYITQRSDQFFGTSGVTASIGKRLRWPDPYFSMSLGVQYQNYNLQDWEWFVLRTGVSNTFALSFAIGRNSVDDPMQYPTQGSDISLAVNVTPPFSLFDKKNYADKSMSDQDRYRWIEYHKWKLKAQWFFPLTPDRKLVLMARAQFGYLGFFNKDKRSPFEGFQMGGDGLSGYSLYGVENVGLRGYENNSLTPYANYGEYANIYSKFTAEMRYPIVREAGTMVYALAFLEAGNAFQRVEEYKPFNLKRSAGVGVRLFLPIVGMIGIDWGYGFDKAHGWDAGISGGQIHFTLGMQL